MLLRILGRDRAIVPGGVAGLTALAWLEPWRRAGEMGMGAVTPRLIPWTPTELGAAALTGSVMMIAMTLPSVAPLVLLFSACSESGASGARRPRRRASSPGGISRSGSPGACSLRDASERFGPHSSFRPAWRRPAPS